MIETLESLVDDAVDAALAEHPRDDPGTLVRKYLSDAQLESGLLRSPRRDP